MNDEPRARPAGAWRIAPLAPADGGAASPVEPPPPRLLLVEDEHVNRFLVQQYMEGTGLTLDIAEDGIQGVRMSQAERYDVILMDIRMPGMNGFEATRRIRQWEQEHGLEPAAIAALTASTVGDDVEAAFRAGCSAHVSKPVTRAELLAIVYELHRLRCLRRRSSGPHFGRQLRRTLWPHRPV